MSQSGLGIFTESIANLTDIEAETVFDISGPMEASFHQRLDPLLAGRAVQGGQGCIPSSCASAASR